VWAEALLLLAITSLSISVISCCIHCIPKLRSGKAGPDDNVRAMTGIASHDTWQGYLGALRAVDADKMFELVSRQIFGMARNNRRSFGLLKIAAYFTIIGVTCLFSSILVVKFLPLVARLTMAYRALYP
jgi:hypothetical protein